MKWFDRLKDALGRRALRREEQQDRKPVVRNLSVMSKVAIVYLVRDESDFDHVRNYVKRIKKELGISRVMALGYVDAKHLPHYMSSRLNYDQFCQKDLDWYRRPHGNTVENFIAEEYEVLIDLTLDDLLPIQHIVAKSRARFKVGRYSRGNERFLDMMIDMAGSQSLPQLITQVHHYLLMVNAPLPEPSLN